MTAPQSTRIARAQSPSIGCWFGLHIWKPRLRWFGRRSLMPGWFIPAGWYEVGATCTRCCKTRGES